MRRRRESPRDIKATDPQIAIALSLLLLAAYLLTADLRFQSIDELAVFSLARSLAGRGALDVDGLYWTTQYLGEGTVAAPGADGHLYSLKDPGLSLLITPLVALAYRVGSSPVRTAFLISPLLTALTGALLYLAARSLGYGRRAGVLGALTFGLASMAWPYAETLFTQPLGAFGVLLATWMAYCAAADHDPRRALVAGLALGLASTAAIALWVLLPVYAAVLVPWGRVRQRRWRDALRSALPLLVAFGVGAGLFVAAEAGYNVARFGSPLDTGHAHTSGLAFEFDTFLVGGVGQLISLPRGLVWYAPFVLLVPFGAALMWRKRRSLVLFVGAQAALVFLLYSSWYDWGGGLAWGPRFLVTLMPLLALLTVPLFERLVWGGRLVPRLAAGGVLAASIFVQLAASLYDTAASQKQLFLLLRTITEAGGFAERWSVLTDPALLPYARLGSLIAERRWGVLWMARGTLDGVLLAGLVAVLITASAWLWLTWRGRSRRVMTAGLLVQGVLSIALAGWMLSRYPHVPNGYQSAEQPGPAGLQTVTAILSEQVAPGDGIVLFMPEDYISWVDHMPSVVPEMNFFHSEPLRQDVGEMLVSVRGWYDRVWVVSTGTVRGNPLNGAELWLAHNAHIGTTVYEDESISLLTYTFPKVEAARFEPAGVHFGEHIELADYTWEIVRRSDAAWLNVTLHWKALGKLPENYNVTAQLWTRDWAPIAQHDGQPGAFYAPMMAWEPGEMVEDRHSIQLPADLPPGPYYLHVGVYDVITGDIVWPVEVPEYLWIPIEIDG